MTPKLVLLGALLLSVAFAAAALPARPFASRTVTLVVPFTPGSGGNTIARVIGPKLDALVRGDLARWQKVVTTAGITAD